MDTFSLSVSSYQRNDHSPASPNQPRVRRERVRSNRQSVAGCISPEERREREREGEGVLLKRRPFDEARPLLRDRERARILLK